MWSCLRQLEPLLCHLARKPLPIPGIRSAENLNVAGVPLAKGRRKPTITLMNKAYIHGDIHRVFAACGVSFRCPKPDLYSPFDVLKVGSNFERDFNASHFRYSNRASVVNSFYHFHNFVLYGRGGMESHLASWRCRVRKGVNQFERLVVNS